MKFGLRYLALAAVAAFAQHAMAAPTVYFGEDLGAGNAAAMTNSFAARDAFVGALTGFGIESFESFASGAAFPAAGALTFAGASITGTLGGGAVLDAPFNGRFAVDGTHFLTSSSIQRINFSAPVAAFGLFVTDYSELDNNPATVTVGGQFLTPQEVAARPFGSVDGIFRLVTQRTDGSFEVLFGGSSFPALDRSGLFAGVIDTSNPLTNVILINGTSGLDSAFQDGFGYDGLVVATLGQVAAVPEPETLALMLAGMVCVGFLARRQRQLEAS